MKSLLILALVLLCAGFAGCATTEPTIQVRTVNVAVPVPCRAAVPDRPAMPTEALAPGVSVDGFVAAAIAEIELREGWEGELMAALRGCVAPAPSK